MTVLDCRQYQISVFRDPEREIELAQSEGFQALARQDLERVALSYPLDWAADPLQDRNWMFQLHGWRMLDPLFNRMKDQDLDHIGNVMEDWYQFWRQNREARHWCWYDMSTGLRASRLAYLLVWCREHKKPVPLFEPLLNRLIAAHFSHLTRLRELNRGNHGLFQLNGLMALVDALKGVPQWNRKRERARRFAVKHMKRLLHRQLGEFGVHTETSPDYHFFALAKIEDVLAAPWWQGPEMEDARTFTDQARVAQHWLVTPSLHCPPVGDSSEAKKLKANDRLREWPHEARDNAMGARLDGYGVVRSVPECTQEESHYLFFQASFHSAGHKHADCLSFIWQEAGEYLLWDAGKYSYQTDSIRDYFVSTRAHNCLEVDGEDYSRRRRHAYGSALQHVGACDDGWLLAGAVNHKTLGLRHQRILFYRPGVGVDVLDLVTNRKRAARTYRLWWQLGAQASVSCDASDVWVNTNGRSLVGRFESTLGPVNLEHYVGVEQPRRVGWLSRNYLQYESAHAISAEATGRGRYQAFVSSWRKAGRDDLCSAFKVSEHLVEVASPTLSKAMTSIVDRRHRAFKNYS